MSDSEKGSDEEPQKDEGELAQEIESKCWEAFLAFDKEGNGQIKSGEAKYVFEMMGIQIEEDDIFRLLAEIDPENTGIITYSDFKMRILERELARLRGSDDTELMDAYVAMGGDEDGGGCVDAKKLISTIKEEF